MAASDRVNDLPEEMMELILESLPLRDAARTSILSKAWSRKWRRLPSLVFDRKCCPGVTDYYELSRKISDIVNSVLEQHRGHIRVFKVTEACPAAQARSWARRVSESPVIQELMTYHAASEDLELDVNSLNNCGRTLSRLAIGCCLPTPDLTLPNLKSLVLYNLCLEEDELDTLVSRFSGLEDLAVRGAGDVYHINISAPNLRRVEINSMVVSITFHDTHANLYEARFSSKNPQLQPRIHNITNLPNLRTLTLHRCFFWTSDEAIPERLPTPFHGLETLNLTLNPVSEAAGLEALCLFRSSPNLTKLNIQFRTWEWEVDGSENMNWMEKIKSDCELEKLREVHLALGNEPFNFRHHEEAELNFIRYMLINSPILDFIRFVLINSPALQVIKVYGDTDKDRNYFYQQINSIFTRSQIVYTRQLLLSEWTTIHDFDQFADQ